MRNENKMVKCFVVAAAFVAGVASASTVGTSSWEPPRTTRRYVHQPMAERMCVLFNDAKVMFSDYVGPPGRALN